MTLRKTLLLFMKKIWVMLVIAAQRNIRKDQNCYVVNESLIQEIDMSVKLVVNILQESSSLQVTNVLQKRVKWNKNS